MRIRVLAAMVATMAPIAVQASAAAENGSTATSYDTAPVPSPAAAAWERYRDSFTAMRREMLASPYARDPHQRAQGLYLMTALEVLAFNSEIGPRQDYPVLQISYQPMELSWGMTNPDFLYRKGLVDGARTYRVYGKRKGNRWATLQAIKGFMGDTQAPTTLGNIDFDDLAMTPDGSFEFFMGPNPPADTGGKSWIKLDQSHRTTILTLRETYYDWAGEEPLDIHIEALDRPSASPIFPSETDLATRIDKARLFAQGAFEFTMKGLNAYLDGTGSEKRERNRFYGSDEGRKQGGNPLGYWVTMQYDIQKDEALIIDMPVIEARYWGFQLGTVWGQTIDFTYHKSSINGTQAVVDRDGRFRAVLSLSDPGVPNWLDPAGIPTGTALLRFYKAASNVTPTVRKVKLDDVRRYLPESTPVVKPEDRLEELNIREKASKRMYNQ